MPKMNDGKRPMKPKNIAGFTRAFLRFAGLLRILRPFFEPLYLFFVATVFLRPIGGIFSGTRGAKNQELSFD
jgi:hypothetical protein